jgi:hypothetical protein
VFETLEREKTLKEKQAPKTEDGKKNDDYNVAFKGEELVKVDIEKKHSIDLNDDGKIIRGNTTEDLVIPPLNNDRNRSNNTQTIKRIFGCCHRRKTIKQVKMSSPTSDKN